MFAVVESSEFGEGYMGDGFVRQHSVRGVVVKFDDRKTYALLREAHDRGRWQVPKGNIDRSETSRSAAVREVVEEGGIIADVLSDLPANKFSYQMTGKKYGKTVDFFLMMYASGSTIGHDDEAHDARWFPSEDALQTLTYESERNVVRTALAKLESPKQTREGSVAS